MDTQSQSDSAQIIESEDQILNYTQGVRLKIVSAVMKEGKIPDADTKDMLVLQQTLDGLDRSALGRKKIKVDESTAGATQAIAAAAIAQMLTQANSIKPFQAEVIEQRPVPVLGSDVPPPRLVEGELDVITKQFNYEEFMQKFAPDAE